MYVCRPCINIAKHGSAVASITRNRFAWPRRNGTPGSTCGAGRTEPTGPSAVSRASLHLTFMMQSSTRNGEKIFKTSDDAGAGLLKKNEGLKKDITKFMKDIDDGYVPRWPGWVEPATADSPNPTSPRNEAGQSEHGYYTALIDRGKVLLVEMTEPQKVKFDKLYARLVVCENKKKAAKEEMERTKGAVDLSESEDDELSTEAEECEIMKEVQRARKKALS